MSKRPGSSPIRLAVVGAGRIGHRHIDLIGANDRLELVAIVDPAPTAADLARSEGVAWHAELEELIAREQPDGLIIATPNSSHLPIGLLAIRHGIPVLIEKPIATSVADGLALASAAREAGVPVLIGHHRRHSPFIQRGREIVRSGALGELVAATGLALFHKPPDYFDAAPWRRERGVGGPILINLVHVIDDLRVLAGEMVAVRAMVSNARRSFDVEDSAAIAIRFADGALGTVLLSDVAASPWGWEQNSSEDDAFSHYKNIDSYQLVGTRAALGVPTLRTWSSRGQPSWAKPMEVTVVTVDRADPWARQLEHFGSVVRGEAEPLVGPEDATQTLRITLAVAESAQSGFEVSTAPAEAADTP